MKKIVKLIGLVSGFLIACSLHAQNLMPIKSGHWIGELHLTKSDTLFFELSIKQSKNETRLTIFNGKEKVQLNKVVEKEGKLIAHFTHFNSELVFLPLNDHELKGEWYNLVKDNYSIPFYAQFKKGTQFPSNKKMNTSHFAGRWKTIFSPNTSKDEAIGVFQQKRNVVTGTFLSETGDYRYLAGNGFGNQLFLSSFDGTHAFLFKGKLNQQEKIEGTFFSGNHFQTTWEAERNSEFQLRHPDSLTHVIGNPSDYSFHFNDLDGTKFSYPNEEYNNKVVIVQILGTWCGNCMDETIYFKELYNKYNKQGLEIITVGYEMGNTEADYIKQLKNFQQRFDVKNKILVGGGTKTSKPGIDLSLSNFMSYPTSIFIDKSGKVVKIHTGFSGPSTGKVFLHYKVETEKLIESLLSK